MKNIHYLLFIIPLLCLVLNVQAQTRSVSGQVLSEEDNEPIPGVSVLLKGTGTGTATDLEGRYSLSVTGDNPVLVFSFVGLESKEVEVGNQSTLDVSLRPDMGQLSEVVVVGYGTAKRQDLTTSVGKLENVQRTVDRPISSAQDMLQGQIAGVTVVANSGQPNETPRVVIRGAGTFSDESPLYVVDGMPYYGGRINPNDIESMVVLKDAAAAAIYGAQAASGVIVITTKSGKTGAPRVNLDVYQGWQSAYQLPEALNAEEYAAAYRRAAEHAGANPNPAHDPNQNPWSQTTRTNWMDEIFRTGAITNLNFQISGGSERGRYSTSIGYHNREGLLQNTHYELFSGRLKGEYDITDKFRVGQNIYFNHSTERGINTSSSYSGAIINAIYMNPAAPVYDEEGNFHGTVPFELSQFAGAYGDTYNPMALLLRPNRQHPRSNLNAITYAEYDILENLTFRSSFSIDMWQWSDRTFSPRAPEIGRPSNMNFLDQSNATRNRWIWDQQLNYNKVIDKHNIGLTGVYTAQFLKEDGFNFQVQDFDREDDWFQYAGNASTILNVPNSYAFEDALTSAIGRVTYDYDDRYFFMGSIRRDQTSRLSPETKTDYFPALSGAWKISSEGFFNTDLVQLLKLRASWGEIGNISSVGYYAYNVPLSAGNNVILGEPGTRNRHVSLNELSNPNLRWERSETYNFGLDLAMLSNRLNFTAEYFEKYTRGLIQRNFPNPHTGVPTGPLSNVGTVLNKGIEFTLGYQGQYRGLSYSVNANMSTLNNELLDLDEFTGEFIQHGTNLRGGIQPFRSEPGQPLFSYHLIPHDGIFQNQEQIDSYTGPNGERIQPNARPGDLIFRDVNGDGRITDADRVFMGNAMPDFTYGLNISLEYKNFDLTLFGQGVGGVMLFNGYKHTAYNAGLQGYNLDRRVLEAWSPENPNATIPVLSTQDPNGNYGQPSDWYLEKGDYFRIRNLSLGYTLPDFVANRVREGMGLRVYLSAENLATFTQYTGLDPEVGSGAVIDNGTFPVPRTFTVGLNLNF
ncbi:SusC/RagA family TonB-linked outer membrane protein [Pleomorphovibrio marinus]|uniref:SusC/RagA family TonB-linked outer membrane protein n=1 Tax=Pleomorphovibrio marinus TaxID=2164132 RepID=UPI000E0BA269|nr:TonB-dependent receptor [Pleomorphovibrio marinus]